MRNETNVLYNMRQLLYSYVLGEDKEHLTSEAEKLLVSIIYGPGI